jgi:hypothetical protein
MLANRCRGGSVCANRTACATTGALFGSLKVLRVMKTVSRPLSLSLSLSFTKQLSRPTAIRTAKVQSSVISNPFRSFASVRKLKHPLATLGAVVCLEMNAAVAMCLSALVRVLHGLKRGTMTKQVKVYRAIRARQSLEALNECRRRNGCRLMVLIKLAKGLGGWRLVATLRAIEWAAPLALHTAASSHLADDQSMRMYQAQITTCRARLSLQTITATK